VFAPHRRPKGGVCAHPGAGRRPAARFFDKMNDWAQGEGQPGLGYIFWREGGEGGKGPIAKNIGPELAEPRFARAGA
jgi:aspartyl-tRNA synthetase